MKKIFQRVLKPSLALILTVVMVFGAAPLSGLMGINFRLPGWFSLTASAQTSGIYTYTVLAGEATITQCDSSVTGAIVIPSELGGYPVTSIGENSFTYISGLTSITIPGSVTNIGSFAFYGCTGVTNLTIPNSVTNISSNAFYFCSGLTSITIPANMTSIGEGVFGYCANLTNITIPDSVTSIGNGAFNSCSKLTSVTISPNVTTISQNAFGWCTALTSITIPNSVTSIGAYAFYHSGLVNITFGTGVTSLGADAFSLTPWMNNQPDGVVYINKIAYNYKGAMPANSAIALNSDTLGIAGGAFRSMPNLTSITIPASVTSIGESAFQACTGLTTVTIPDGMTSLGNYIFNGCSGLTSIIIPTSVTSIGEGVFQSCYRLSSIAIPAGVTSIGNGAFQFCTGLTTITIPDGVTSLANDIFSNCTGLTSIMFPAGLTSIGDGTFQSCAGLTTLTIPVGVTSLGDNAFSYCSGLTSITIPASVTSLGRGAFQSCTGLTTITIPDSLTSINDNLFYDCTKLTSVIIPTSVTTIGDFSFSWCSSLTSVYIPDSVTTISNYSFYAFSNLTIFGTAESYAKTFATTNTIPFVAVNPVITFDANGGTGGTSGAVEFVPVPTPPVVTRAGYVFAGWSPAIKQAIETITYTAQWVKYEVAVTKLESGLAVNIKGWEADSKYQIWSYQKVTSDFLLDASADVPANQWILSQAYTLGSEGVLQPDGSKTFIIPDFVSPDKNYTISVRAADSGNNFINEVRDSYTPADVLEVVINKVLVDGEASRGDELKEITTSSSVLMKVLCNDVAVTTYSAKVVGGTTNVTLTVSNTNEFLWNTSGLTPGNYTVEFTASNGTTTDKKVVSVQLYSSNSSFQFGELSSMDIAMDAGTSLPKTIGIDPAFTNGSFYYRINEPGRKAIVTSGLFNPADTIGYDITKYGVYYVTGFVNRTYEVKIGNYYDDGLLKTITVSRSETPSTATLTANEDITQAIAKSTPLLFTAGSSIGGIGATQVQYSFWRYDAKGYVLVKDWSDSNTLSWTPARVGNYSIEVRAKGIDAGSYEAIKGVKVTVTDEFDQIAQNVAITANSAELNTNAQARTPIMIKAAATASNGDDLLYKFIVKDGLGGRTLQAYSVNQECVWTPGKSGTYTISVLVKNTASFGQYDAIQSFDVVV